MRTVTVEVTAEDIAGNADTTLGRRCSTCPVAVALSRALGRAVLVFGPSWRMAASKDYYGNLPHHVRKQISSLDNGAVIPPFTFTVEVP